MSATETGGALATLEGSAGQHTPIPSLTVTETTIPSLTITNTPSPTSTPEPSITPTPEYVVFAGAGDISICGQEGDEQTAALIEMIQPDIVFTLGDNSNAEGTWEEYLGCYDASWGKFRGRIRPIPGNHDYYTEKNAASYYEYFGTEAGEIGKGYYSYDLGEWHIVALNSNCLNIDGCGPSSPQVAWLENDLEINEKKCTLAYWHHPRWSSGIGDNAHWLDAFLQVLYRYNAEVVLSGDHHHYERFAPQNPAGELDLENGIRQFVVGTGGAGHMGFDSDEPNSEIKNTGDFGVMKLTLYPDRYDWEFIPVEGADFTDSGTDYCH